MGLWKDFLHATGIETKPARRQSKPSGLSAAVREREERDGVPTARRVPREEDELDAITEQIRLPTPSRPYYQRRPAHYQGERWPEEPGRSADEVPDECHHCKKPIAGQPVSFHSPGKTSTHFHPHHAKYAKHEA
jgi:hypothetical protein